MRDTKRNVWITRFDESRVFMIYINPRNMIVGKACRVCGNIIRFKNDRRCVFYRSLDHKEQNNA